MTGGYLNGSAAPPIDLTHHRTTASIAADDRGLTVFGVSAFRNTIWSDQIEAVASDVRRPCDAAGVLENRIATASLLIVKRDDGVGIQMFGRQGAKLELATGFARSRRRPRPGDRGTAGYGGGSAQGRIVVQFMKMRRSQ